MADIGYIAARRTVAHRRLSAAVGRLAAMAKVDAPRPVTNADSAHDPQFGQMLELERMADFLDRLSGELGVGPEPEQAPEPEPPAPRVETLTERRQREYAEDLKREEQEQEEVATANWPAAAKPQPNPPPAPSKQIPTAPDLETLGTEGSQKTTIPPEPEQQQQQQPAKE